MNQFCTGQAGNLFVWIRLHRQRQMKTFYDPDSISFRLFLRNHHWSNLRPSIPMSARRYGRKMKRFSCCTFPSYIKTFLQLAAILIAKCFLFSPGKRFVWFSQSVMFKVFGSQRETDKIVYWGIWFFTSIIWAFFPPQMIFPWSSYCTHKSPTF